jgi:hypothetical protein
VVDVSVEREADGRYTFEVEVRHADEGWQHYADRWEIVDEGDHILATRVLRHPHVTEQPFRRALAGVEIPSETTTVTVRAHDSVHGYGGAERRLVLPATSPSQEPERLHGAR